MPSCPQMASLQKQLAQELVRLHGEYASELSRFAASFSQDEDVAGEAIQNVFLRYFIERRYGRQIDNARSWLYHLLRDELTHLSFKSRRPERRHVC
jgi:DNA-directed RNA polymerase specialized sigma24 family protein